MTVWKTLPATVHLLLLFLMMPLAASAADGGVPFSVIGEQLDHHPPDGWKLAWMSGKADGSYIVEYIPGAEEIVSWRDGYLAIERLEYPPAEVLKKLEKIKMRVADVALYQFVRKTKETCGGQYTEMPQRAGTFNGTYFAIGGGYCDRYGPAAPFGEGAIFAFADGATYLFRLQYGWRPRTTQDQESNVPWRVAPLQAMQYLDAIQRTSLCGGLDQPACRHHP